MNDEKHAYIFKTEADAIKFRNSAEEVGHKVSQVGNAVFADQRIYAWVNCQCYITAEPIWTGDHQREMPDTRVQTVYRKTHKEVKLKLQNIRQMTEAHKKNAGDKPNWGDVGKLSRVSTELDDIARFLGDKA